MNGKVLAGFDLYVYDVYRSYCFTHFYRHKIIMYTGLGPNFYISGVAT